MAALLNQLEALLFVSGDQGMALEELIQLLDVAPDQVYALLEHYQEKLEANDSALEVLQTAGRFKLVTRAAYSSLLETYAQSAYNHRLSQAALEILAIIAYKQPVTRLEIEDIRGVSSSGPIQKLLMHDLIKEDGRLDLPGRPFLYVTTDRFLEAFGLNDLDDLIRVDLDLEDDEKDLLDYSIQQTKEDD